MHDINAFRRRLRVNEDALEEFMDAYGPETAVGEDFWNFSDEDESFEDSGDWEDLEEAVGAPRWEVNYYFCLKCAKWKKCGYYLECEYEWEAMIEA